MIVYKPGSSCPLECKIEGLSNEHEYFVRLAAGNHKGYSEWCYTTPPSLAPSSWRQLDPSKRKKYDELAFRKFTKLILLNRHILEDRSSTSSVSSRSQPSSHHLQSLRLLGDSTHSSDQQQQTLNLTKKSNLLDMLLLDATDCSEASGFDLHGSSLENSACDHEIEPQPTASSSQSSSVRKNIKNFFQPNSFKFYKLNNQNKRGLYLCSIIYHGEGASSARGSMSTKQVGGNECGKIVVTNDDRLPIIEVMNELVSPAALLSDFYWLLKISGTHWIDIRRLRQQLQKSHSSSSLHLRIKLLNAIEQMQSALNVDDIGRLFYRPIQSHDGSIVVCTCRQVSNSKLVSSLSIKWTSQHKIIPRHLRKISDSMLFNSKQQQESQCQISPSASSSSIPALQPSSGNLYSLQQPQSPSQNQNQASPVGHESQGATGAHRDFLLSAGWRHCGAAQQQGAKPSNITDSCSDFLSGSQLVMLGQYNCDACNQQRKSQATNLSSSSSLINTNSSASSSGNVNSGLNSSQSSLASARDGQSSVVTGARSYRCALCGRTSLNSSGPSQQLVFNSVTSSSSNNNPRLSTSSAIYPAPNRSGSMYLGVGSSPFGSRHSQPIGCSPQSASPYLLLASLTIYDLLLFSLAEMIQFDQLSKIQLKRGLYLGFLQMSATVESMRLLVPRSRPNMLPCIRIRDNSHVSKEEWMLLQRFASAQPAKSSTKQNSNISIVRTTQTSGLLDFEVQQDMSRAKSASPGRPGSPIGSNHHLSASIDHLVGNGDKVRRQREASSYSSSTSSASTGPLLRRVKAPNLTTGDSISDPQLNESSDHQNRSSSRAASFGDRAGAVLRRDANLHPSVLTPHSRLPMMATGELLGSINSPGETFVRLIGSAAKRLLTELKAALPKVYDQQLDKMVSIFQSLNEPEQNRIYHLALIELSNNVNFILLIPSVENVCPVTSQDNANILSNNQEYMLLPMQFFETLHIGSYEPDLLGKYSRLSAILETDLILAQHDHRQAFSSNELKSAKNRVSKLQEMVSITDDFWRQMRWIADVVAFARDKSLSPTMSGIRVGSIWNHFDLAPFMQKAAGRNSDKRTRDPVHFGAHDPPKQTPSECQAESSFSANVELIISDPKRALNLALCHTDPDNDGCEPMIEYQETESVPGRAYHISLLDSRQAREEPKTERERPLVNNQGKILDAGQAESFNDFDELLEQATLARREF